MVCIIWYGMIWYGMLCYGMVCYVMVCYDKNHALLWGNSGVESQNRLTLSYLYPFLPRPYVTTCITSQVATSLILHQIRLCVWLWRESSWRWSWRPGPHFRAPRLACQGEYNCLGLNFLSGIFLTNGN